MERETDNGLPGGAADPGQGGGGVAASSSSPQTDQSSEGVRSLQQQQLQQLAFLGNPQNPTVGGNNNNTNPLLSGLSYLLSTSTVNSAHLPQPAPQMMHQQQLASPDLPATLLPHFFQQQSAIALPPQLQQLGPLYQQLMTLLLLQQAQTPGSNSNISSNSMNNSVSNSVNGPASSGLDVNALLYALSATSNQQARPTAPHDSNMTSTQPTQFAPSGDPKTLGHTSGGKSENLREAAIKKGAKIIPCRARGLHMDHNIHTAFFEIPEDAVHGNELVCTYPACRNSGVRFLYCMYCDAAISRRGFKTKHIHEDLCKAGEAQLVGKSKSAIAAKKRIQEVSHQRAEAPLENISKDSSSMNDANDEGGWESDGNKKAKKQKQGRSLRINELQRDWTRLLDECGAHSNAVDDDSKKATWLQKVQSIYDEYSTLTKLDSSE